MKLVKMAQWPKTASISRLIKPRLKLMKGKKPKKFGGINRFKENKYHAAR